MKKLIIIKLGGSIITYKDNPLPKARIKIIKNLSWEIAQLYILGYKIILIHGGGSFGHPFAKKYKVNQGVVRNPKEAFSNIAEITQQLNKIIMNQLLKEKLPVISLLPRSFITQTQGIMNDFDYSIIESLVKKDFIPVLCGDIVFDNKFGCSILSGDTIVSFLANKLQASEVIFLSDVDGIFDKNPKKYKDAKLISKVNNQNFDQILKGIEAGDRADVTGEMTGKILSIQTHLKRVRVIIASGLKTGNLINLTKGNAVGTEIWFD